MIKDETAKVIKEGEAIMERGMEDVEGMQKKEKRMCGSCCKL